MPYLIDPLTDPRWPVLLQSHAAASVFHSRPWLHALRESYGYKPIVLTSSPPGEVLGDGLAFCRVESWLTGRRWVSLPFSDHVEPLLPDASALPPLLRAAEEYMASERLRYVELRPLTQLSGGFLDSYQPSEFVLHNLDLSPSLDTLHRNLHSGSVKGQLRRAEREALEYSQGRSSKYLDAFYSLLQRTRRRHAIPPQPRAWFENLVRSFGPQLQIHLASHRGLPIASMLTLQFKSTLTYKYACSDKEHHALGGMQLVMWRAIEAAKQENLTNFDLGRSDLDNPGLITYKDRWGAARTPLVYRRKSLSTAQPLAPVPGGWKQRVAAVVFTHLPSSLNTIVGQALYRHIG